MALGEYINNTLVSLVDRQHPILRCHHNHTNPPTNTLSIMVLGLNSKSSASDPNVLHNRGGAIGNPSDYAHLVKDAATADAAEHDMSVKQAFKIHKKAVFWSMALSAALIVGPRKSFCGRGAGCS